MNRRRTDAAPADIGVVVPMLNESEGLDALFARLEPALASISANYEIVCVDDGSTDGTLRELVARRARDPRIKVVALSRNFGKDVALSAGLDHSHALAVVPMDADGQDPPEMLPLMWAKRLEGYDVVLAVRSCRRTDGWLKRVTARGYYRLHNRLADTAIPPDAGDFRMMDRRVVEALRCLPERTRFMKGLFAWVGFSHASVEYERPGRMAGQSKWGWWKLWNFALDGITASSSTPLRVWTYLGAAVAGSAFLFALWVLADTLLNGNDVPGYASTMIAVLGLGGLNILATGILGEYLARVYTEVRSRPLYVVSERHGLDAAGAPAAQHTSGETPWTAASSSASTPSRASTGGSAPVVPFSTAS